MALPTDNPSAKTAAVAEEIKKMGPKDLASFPDLEADDLLLFGTLIQYFAFMDLNLRRALEVFYKAKMLPKEYLKFYPKLQDSKLTEAAEGPTPRPRGPAASTPWTLFRQLQPGPRHITAAAN
jgi:hypothetical protein